MNYPSRRLPEKLRYNNRLNFIIHLLLLIDVLCFNYVTISSVYGDKVEEKIIILCKNMLYELFNEYKRIHSDQHVKITSSSLLGHLDFCIKFSRCGLV